MRETKTKIAPSKPKVSREEYKKFIDGLQITNLVLRESKCMCVEGGIDFSKQVDPKVTDKASYRAAGEKSCKVTHTYEFNAAYAGTADPLVSITVAFDVTLDTTIAVTQDNFDIFKNGSLPLMTWPYFREFVHSTIMRMGLPPLILPAVKRG